MRFLCSWFSGCLKTSKMIKSMFRISSQHALWRLRGYLKRGGVIAYPTESCYGIGALPRHVGAIKKIIRLKKRPQNKGLIVIGCNFTQLSLLLIRQLESVQQQLQAIWPAPKTFVLPARSTLSPLLRGSRRQKLAVRVPDHDVARTICDICKSPLISTSCNRSGKYSCRSAREVKRQFGQNVWVLAERIGGRRQPSEIIDWSSQERLR